MAKDPDASRWPVRTEGWEARLAEKTRVFLAELAERHGLAAAWGHDAPVEVCCTFPKQAGLDFELSLALSHDELTLSHDLFRADLFPLDRPSTWSDFARLADGMLGGEARGVVYHCGDPRRWYRTEAQIREDGVWCSVSTGLAPWRWRPFGRRVEVVRNEADGRVARPLAPLRHG